VNTFSIFPKQVRLKQLPLQIRYLWMVASTGSSNTYIRKTVTVNVYYQIPCVHTLFHTENLSRRKGPHSFGSPLHPLISDLYRCNSCIFRNVLTNEYLQNMHDMPIAPKHSGNPVTKVLSLQGTSAKCWNSWKIVADIAAKSMNFTTVALRCSLQCLLITKFHPIPPFFKFNNNFLESTANSC